ncbi:hypothetical protein MKW98_027253 [Papaver atlanticum]|uniref:Copine C-terminal domain-containing protein n=1 Tax=Papaver atlanticum TaxID=357466 RepID=A0AAD4XIJ8_9MAGN|nr:hypothetical protein MKW98_027253 [Papaver atlanticum]
MGNKSCKRSNVSPSIITLRKEVHLGALKEVSEGLKQKGVQFVNLIVGVCYTRREGWAARETNLHRIIEGNPNNYERVIFLVGKTIKALNEDNTIHCFGFGDATTNTSRIFRFYREEVPSPGFEEAATRYNLIAKYARLTEKVSYDVIIRKAISVASQSRDQHHVLVIIASEPVSRSLDTQPGNPSVDDHEQNSINAIVMARNYRLSIVLVGVGEANEHMMRRLRNRITGADNFKFVDYTQIMSTNEPLERKENEFCLAVFEHLLTEITESERLHILR